MTFFEEKRVLENSLLIQPLEIWNALNLQGAEDGWHRVLYDKSRRYVQSEPEPIAEVSPSQLVEKVEQRIVSSALPLSETVRRIVVGLERPMPTRDVRIRDENGEPMMPIVFDQVSRFSVEQARRLRLENYRRRSRSEEDALALSLGVETWSMGMQLILATRADQLVPA